MLALVLKIAGSNPAEAVGFFGRKNPQYAFLLWYPRSRVQTRPKPSDFSGEKIHSMPSFGREVNQFVPCRRFAARKRTLLDYVEVGSLRPLKGGNQNDAVQKGHV
jgi:hypothetical protein